MTTDIIFTKISEPELISGAWYVHLQNQREEIKVKVEDAFAPLISIADRDNDKFITTHFNDLYLCLEFGDITIHIIQYDIQNCYIRFELYIDGHLFRANIESWRALAFAKAYNITIVCAEELWHEIVSDLSLGHIICYPTESLEMALPLIRHMANDEFEPPSVRELAAMKESLVYRELGKRQKEAQRIQIGGIIHSLQRLWIRWKWKRLRDLPEPFRISQLIFICRFRT